MPKRYDIPEEELRELYLQEGLSIQERANHYGCSSTLIENGLRRYDIPTRAPGSEPIGLSEEALTELSVEAELSTVEIAERFDCHNSTISRKLEEYDVPTHGSNHGHAVDVPEDELRRLYVDREHTVYELADRYDCDRPSSSADSSGTASRRDTRRRATVTGSIRTEATGGASDGRLWNAPGIAVRSVE